MNEAKLNPSPVVVSEAEILAELHTNKNDVITKIVELAHTQKRLEAELLALDEEMAKKADELKSIKGGPNKEGELPKLLASVGLSGLPLEDGTLIQVDTVMNPPSVAQTSKHREAVLKWLRDAGYQDVIKGEVKVPLSAGDVNRGPLLDDLKRLGVEWNEYETVNASTLKSLINELMEKGIDVPLEEIGVFIFKVARVVLPE